MPPRPSPGQPDTHTHDTTQAANMHPHELRTQASAQVLKRVLSSAVWPCGIDPPNLVCFMFHGLPSDRGL